MSATLEQDLEASHWGIDPVPDEHRKLSGFDLGVLWGDLGIGLLVIVAGALLVAPPEQFGFGLSVSSAFVSVVLGSIIGCVLLGIGGVIGSREARPTMALLRPVLGERGSWLPTVLNVAQLVGWTAFELWAMALVGSRLGDRLFGFSSFVLWLLFFSVVVLALSLWGPLGVVRVWMERFGAWVIVAIGLAITVAIVARGDLGSPFSKGAGGAVIFGGPMDLVIAMPVSWIPLVADYTRFSRRPRPSFMGTTLGYAIANVWFYMLGALIVVSFPETVVNPEGIAISILALSGIAISGTLLLSGLLVGETDEAFADVYSGAVSLRNIFPKVDNRVLVIAVTVMGALLAGSFTMLTYELFLFLLGSVFLPLLGVWFADYFVLNNRLDARGIRWRAIVPWVAGFIVYHWIAPTPYEPWLNFTASIFGTPISRQIPWLGASIPSFLVAFALHSAVGSVSRNVSSRAS